MKKYQAQPITDLAELRRGDLVRHKSGWESYVVEDRCGDAVIAVRTVLVTNPREWEVVRLADEVTGAAKESEAAPEMTNNKQRENTP